MRFIKGGYEALNQSMKQVKDNNLTIIGNKWGMNFLLGYRFEVAQL